MFSQFSSYMTIPLFPEVPRRPPLPVRTSSSYSKRHASCNSPREVPLPPSPSIQRHNPFQLSADTDPHLKGKGVDPLSSITSSPFEHATNDSNEANNSLPSVSSMPTLQSPGHLSNLTLTDPRVRANHISSQTLDLPGAREMPENSHAPGLPSQTQGSSPLFPFSRPYSLPDAHSNSYGPATLSVSSTTNPSWPDRTSCASLPLPMQTPYFTLPQALSSEEGKESSQNGPIDPPGAEWLTKGKPEAKILDKTSVQRSGPRQPLDQTPSSPSGSVCFAPTAMPSTPSILSRCSSLSQSSNYPPPTPPTILAPSPPPGVEETRIQAPYEPFLSHAPPPEDSWIAVETTPSDYTLIVRLPGFKRDGM
jgi:hypothetical protein